MKFSEAWLREWVNPAVSTVQLADQLSMAGLEVDAIEPAAAEFSRVLVGRVEQISAHPDADKLRVCQVDVGAHELLQIVCGAANVAEQMRVPVAIVGARLPGDFKIKKAKLRGVASAGMICSASELGLAETSSGIMPLPQDAPVGRDLRDYLQLDDQCIDVDLTPDRGDCLSIRGVASEVGVINRCTVDSPAMPDVEVDCQDKVEVTLSAAEQCPRYLCRVIKGLASQAPTPLWMQERLRRAGLRSINAVVDVTNYVMLELGQPMHGFDLAQINGAIQVRLATANEKITLLDEQEIELKTDTLVIADAGKALAIAGIMGGLDSGVSDSTEDVLLESAFFAPLAMAGKARRYGLHTDSSHRFERGVDWALPRQALQRASALLMEICGGQAGPVVEALSEPHLPAIPEILLRRSQIKRILGIEMDDESVLDILQRLGMQVSPQEQGWQVRPPSARFDLSIEVDLLEELGRIYGYNNIAPARSHLEAHPAGRAETAFDLERARDTLVARGFSEAICYSFVSPEQQQMFNPDIEGIRLSNPISADMSVMRSSLWPGLMQALLHNRARQQPRVRLFESGLRFVQDEAGIQQDNMLAAVACGSRVPQQWATSDETLDFFDLKAEVEQLLALTADVDAFTFVAETHPALHPGQSARIYRAQQAVGWLGMLHPALEKSLAVGATVGLFELQLEPLQLVCLPAFQALSKFPAIRRDISILVEKKIPFADIKQAIQKIAPGILQDIFPFDVYTGGNIDSSLRSLSLGLILQDSSKTLVDEEIEQVVQGVLSELEKRFSAQLRS
ncbi:MAG: phenylalanine--tRNA ligase subunit beta [gamma proteobacterium symbiont of Bathyaustriella thionipta]|nr:phenylalanine--tRNA ligase subunit beta [gamma proteobacterium symbiont of Bathyaustriella thionipta]